MEKRVLSKVSHPSIVELYHTFQDYNALYYLMEFAEGAEMWTNIMTGAKLTGAHETQARFWGGELVEVRGGDLGGERKEDGEWGGGEAGILTNVPIPRCLTTSTVRV